MESQSNLKFIILILGWGLMKLSTAILWADLFVLFVFILEGVELSIWIFPLIMLGFSLGLWLMGTALRQFE